MIAGIWAAIEWAFVKPITKWNKKRKANRPERPKPEPKLKTEPVGKTMWQSWKDKVCKK